MQDKDTPIIRPTLSRTLRSDDFRNFYWLKEELVTFCREHNIPSTGSKEELATKIELFLENAVIEQKRSDKNIRFSSSTQKKGHLEQKTLSVHTIITENYRSDQAHRAFFQSIIGPHFHFTTHFMKFMKEHVGKTYQDAIDEWHREQEWKKDPVYRSSIAPQFEYNQYIRAYFENNPGKTLQDAIHSWNVKKKRRGSTTYSRDDDEKEQV